MYFVYILYSQKCDRYYVGYASDVEVRLERHNKGWVAATKNCRPYILKATFKCKQESDSGTCKGNCC